MTPDEWAVVAGGAAAVAWVNWYFFGGSGSSGVISAMDSAVPEVEIVVEGGYAPREVRIPAGRTARLVFDRREAAGCSEELVIADFRVRKFLAPHERTAIEITPESPGTHEFTCGMGMLRGRIVVEDRDANHRA